MLLLARFARSTAITDNFLNGEACIYFKKLANLTQTPGKKNSVSNPHLLGFCLLLDPPPLGILLPSVAGGGGGRGWRGMDIFWNNTFWVSLKPARHHIIFGTVNSLPWRCLTQQSTTDVKSNPVSDILFVVSFSGKKSNFNSEHSAVSRQSRDPSLACEYSRFSLFLTARVVSPGGTSATQGRKFHTDDVKSVRNPVRGSDLSTE